MMREILFRAWAKHTVDNQFQYAWNASRKECDKSEPAKTSNEWDEWYNHRDERYHEFLEFWSKQHDPSEIYTETFEMITGIKVNGEVTRPYGYEIIDVMQYTGLTDKNGKMIFEGDKVAVLNPKPFARTTGTVVFIDGCFEVKFHREDYGRDYLKCLTCNHECEVIGNIYDNPELLKEET